MITLHSSTLLGSALTVTLFWAWQGNWRFGVLVASIGGSFAALVAACVLTVVGSFLTHPL